MQPTEALKLAESLAGKRDVEALRLLVRQAALPLLAEGMLAWARKRWQDVPRDLERVIPPRIAQTLNDGGALPYLADLEVEVDLGRDTVISFPWEPARMKNALERLSKEPWRYDPINHFAYLYRPLGVVLAYNGLHSIAVGILKGEGRIRAKVVDLGPAYNAGFRVDWREKRPLLGLFGKAEWVAYGVLGDMREPIPYPNHALLLALGEILQRHGIEL